MFGAIAGGIASALAGGAMSKLFGGGLKAASGGIQGDVLAPDNNLVGRGDAGIKFAIQGSNVFFSSRGRHTILQGDWSSDVCSSDLAVCGWQLSRLQRQLPLPLEVRGYRVPRENIPSLLGTLNPLPPPAPLPLSTGGEGRKRQVK